MINYISQRSIKQAVDNLPEGICFFNQNNMLVLCNLQMYRLAYLIMGRDFQSYLELSEVLENPVNPEIIKENDVYLFPDGTAWQFKQKNVIDNIGVEYIEITAGNVTKLHNQNKKLKESLEAQQKIIAHIENIASNVTAIAREEEILTMKMNIHNQLGYNLQSARNFLINGCPNEAKKEFLAEQRKIAYTILGEVGKTDEVNVYEELVHVAQVLGISIMTDGELPKDKRLRALVVSAIRENLTNTLNHAKGDCVYVKISKKNNLLSIKITNNGNPPEKEIKEGGGLTSLRSQIEKFAGEMKVTSYPQFCLELELYEKGDSYL